MVFLPPSGGVSASATDSMPGSERRRLSQRVQIGGGAIRRIAVRGEARVDRDDLLIVEARVRGHHAIERSNEKPRDDEQHAARRDLRADQELPHQGRPMALARDLQRRREPEQDRGRDATPMAKAATRQSGATSSHAGAPVIAIRLRRTA